MRMAVEVNAAVVRLVPHSLAVVEQNDHRVTGKLQLIVVSDADDLPLLEKVLPMLDDGRVMVAQDQLDVTIEAPEIVLEFVVWHECHVTIVKHLVARLDDLVPLLQHQLVHLRNVLEWALGILDDVGVTPMGITDEPVVHVGQSMFRWMTRQAAQVSGLKVSQV